MSNPIRGVRPRPTLTTTKKSTLSTLSADDAAHRLAGAPPPSDAAAMTSAFASGSETLSALAQFDGGDARENLNTLSALDSLTQFGNLSDKSALERDSRTLAGLEHVSRLSDGRYRRFKLSRDRDRPLEFDGRVVAQVEELSHGVQVLLRAAIYETRGGKFVTEMTRREIKPPVDYGTAKRPYLFAKASIFDNLDLAAMSFRTSGGRLTERLLQQIGDLQSEFIE